MDLYKQAALKKLRFNTQRGQLSVEDLFDLPLTSSSGKPNLDDLAKGYFKRIKEAGEVASFVDETKKPESDDQLAFDLIKDVIEVKKAKQARRAKAAENRERRQRIMQIMEDRKDKALSEASLEDLQAELNNLGSDDEDED